MHRKESEAMVWLRKACKCWEIYISVIATLAGWGILGGICEGFVFGLAITLTGKLFVWLAIDTQTNLDRQAEDEEIRSNQDNWL